MLSFYLAGIRDRSLLLLSIMGMRLYSERQLYLTILRVRRTILSLCLLYHCSTFIRQLGASFAVRCMGLSRGLCQVAKTISELVRSFSQSIGEGSRRYYSQKT